MLTRGRIAGADFHGGRVNVTPASQEQCRRLQQSRTGADPVIGVFVAYTATMTHNAFSGPDNPQILPLPLEGSGRPSNTWFLDPTTVTH